MSQSNDGQKTLRDRLGGERVSLKRGADIASLSESGAEPGEVPVRSLPLARARESEISRTEDLNRLPDIRSPELEAGLPQVPSRQLRVAQGRGELPQLPRRPTRRSHGTLLSFFLFVVLPTVLAAYYFTFVASNQYISEFRFAVKDASPNKAAAVVSVASSLLGPTGGSGAPNASDNYVVTDYLGTSQAVRDLQERIKVIDLYSSSNVDWWSRFNSTRPLEWFVSYWQHMMTAQYDPMTGIASVQVRAFSPSDAKRIADTMLKMSEELINRMVVRMQTDTVRFAQNEVRRGEERVKAVRSKLTEFRNRTGVIDPSGSLVASNSQLVQTLQANLTQLETQMSSLKAERLGPGAPAVQRLASQIKATQDQIAAVERSVSKNMKGSSLADTVAQYEQLDLERQFAQTLLTGAQQSLDQARATASAQFLYIEPYVRPTLPESSVYPRRAISILLTAFFSLVAWMVLLLTARSVREHYA